MKTTHDNQSELQCINEVTEYVSVVLQFVAIGTYTHLNILLELAECF